jgi:putative ABC transport system ATP-binding protein
MEQRFLVIKDLKKVYNLNAASEVCALNDVSFTADKGEFIVIVGSNAAGKSTLFDVIAGSVSLDKGEILLEGKPITGLPEYKRAKFISRVWQNSNNGVVDSMTVAENLSMAKMRSSSVGLRPSVKHEWKKEFTDTLEKFHLGLEKRLDDGVNLLSGGQKQIIALVMATLTHPKLLLLDEHTASLDTKMNKLVLGVTEKIVRENNITTLMITHNINQAIQYGDRLILLNRGNIVLDLPKKEKQNISLAAIVEKMDDYS